MDKDRILLIQAPDEDQAAIAAVLRREGFSVEEAFAGAQGLDQLREFAPHLLLLDQDLPDTDGLDVCRRVRRQLAVPIIMLSSKDAEVDKVVGLEVGADDYMTKPVGLRELVARVRAVLRRTEFTEAVAQQKRLSFAHLEIDGRTRTVQVTGESVHLTPKEFDLLFYLALRENVVVPREDISREVWDLAPGAGDSRTVNTHIMRLRKKIIEGRDVPFRLATIWGVGYRFIASEAGV